ncbi:MAG: helix-turn-helix domain-containing protein [Solirubrobacteraceae bacterium]
MAEPTPSIPIPEAVLDALAERVAAIVIGRIGGTLRANQWMRTAAAAEYLGLTRSALYSRRSDIPHYKVDRLLLFKREELDAWIAQYRREPERPQSWVRSATAATSRRHSQREPPGKILRVRPRNGAEQPARPKRGRPLPPPLNGDEAQKDKWAWELEISRADLDAMNPKEFKTAWAARNERLREGGVFERIGELLQSLGSKGMDELQPSALIRAVQDLDQPNDSVDTPQSS